MAAHHLAGSVLSTVRVAVDWMVEVFVWIRATLALAAGKGEDMSQKMSAGALEAGASMTLQVGSSNPAVVPIIKEWFEARRLLGIQAYSDDELLPALKKALEKKS